MVRFILVLFSYLFVKYLLLINGLIAYLVLFGAALVCSSVDWFCIWFIWYCCYLLFGLLVVLRVLVVILLVVLILVLLFADKLYVIVVCLGVLIVLLYLDLVCCLYLVI